MWPTLPELYLHLLKTCSGDAVLNPQQRFLDSHFLSSPFSHTLDALELLVWHIPQTLLHNWMLRGFYVSCFADMPSTVLSFPLFAWIFLSDGKSLRTDTVSSNLSCFLPSTLVESGFLFSTRLHILLILYHQCRGLDWLRMPLPSPQHLLWGGGWGKLRGIKL